MKRLEMSGLTGLVKLAGLCGLVKVASALSDAEAEVKRLDAKKGGFNIALDKHVNGDQTANDYNAKRLHIISERDKVEKEWSAAKDKYHDIKKRNASGGYGSIGKNRGGKATRSKQSKGGSNQPSLNLGGKKDSPTLRSYGGLGGTAGKATTHKSTTEKGFTSIGSNKKATSPKNVGLSGLGTATPASSGAYSSRTPAEKSFKDKAVSFVNPYLKKVNMGIRTKSGYDSFRRGATKPGFLQKNKTALIGLGAVGSGVAGYRALDSAIDRLNGGTELGKSASRTNGDTPGTPVQTGKPGGLSSIFYKKEIPNPDSSFVNTTLKGMKEDQLKHGVPESKVLQANQGFEDYFLGDSNKPKSTPKQNKGKLGLGALGLEKESEDKNTSQSKKDKDDGVFLGAGSGSAVGAGLVGTAATTAVAKESRKDMKGLKSKNFSDKKRFLANQKSYYPENGTKQVKGMIRLRNQEMLSMGLKGAVLGAGIGAGVGAVAGGLKNALSSKSGLEKESGMKEDALRVKQARADAADYKAMKGHESFFIPGKGSGAKEGKAKPSTKTSPFNMNDIKTKKQLGLRLKQNKGKVGAGLATLGLAGGAYAMSRGSDTDKKAA